MISMKRLAVIVPAAGIVACSAISVPVTPIRVKDAPAAITKPMVSAYLKAPAFLPSVSMTASVAHCEADNGESSTLLDRFSRVLSFESDCITYKTERNGVKIGTRNYKDIGTFRLGECECDATTEQLASVWWDVSHRNTWDSATTEKCEVVERYGSDQQLIHLKSKPKKGGVISSRDFVYLCRRYDMGDGTIVFVSTSQKSGLPSESGYVRGEVNTVLTLTPMEGGRTHMTYAGEIQPNGWVPSWAVEAAGDDVVAALAHYRDYTVEHFKA